MQRGTPYLREGEILVIGPRWSPRVHEIKDFLSRSRIRFRWHDAGQGGAPSPLGPEDEDGKHAVVQFPDGSELVDPDIRSVADKLGLDTEPDFRDWDLVIIGGGPAGIAAGIYGGSEGLRTLVLEQAVPGGQAGYSARIENYPGFPEGLSGSELARRGVRQAERFGVEVLFTRRATKLRADTDPFLITLDDGTELESRAVLLALGVSFRWLEAPGCPQLVGAGIYYGAATAEAHACAGQDIYILGGGNSAGQAALLLARYARSVSIVTNEGSIEDSMSAYLIDRIQRADNIRVMPNHTITAAEGGEHLDWITLQDLESHTSERVPANGLFVFIGATPHTDWLPPEVLRDDEGFILSGYDLQDQAGLPPGWPLERRPFGLETSVPGIFVAGDVRKGSVKRLTSAAGEGASVIEYVHRHCAVR